MTLFELDNLNGFTQAEVWPMYANLIITGAPDCEIVRINEMIIDRWSNAALILIKDKAWRLVKQVEKGKHLRVC